jgi:hypothetical protein
MMEDEHECGKIGAEEMRNTKLYSGSLNEIGSLLEDNIKVLAEVGTTRTNFLACDVMLSSRSLWRSFGLMYYLSVRDGRVSRDRKQTLSQEAGNFMIIYVTINFSRRVFSMELLTVYQHAPKLQ